MVGFEPAKISVAMTKAFLAVNGGQGAASARMRELVAALTDSVVAALVRRQPQGGTFHIEDIQDQVELALMRSGEHDVARAYVLYREERAQERARAEGARAGTAERAPRSTSSRTAQRRPLDLRRARARWSPSACDGLGRARRRPRRSSTRRCTNLYDGVPMDEVHKSAILAARALIEKDPAYSYVTARLLLHTIRQEVLGEEVSAGGDGRRATPSTSRSSSSAASRPSCSTRELAQFDLRSSARRSSRERDLQFNYLGLQTLYDRYFLHIARARASSCRRPSSCAWRWAWR